jgi:hypothetical protein
MRRKAFHAHRQRARRIFDAWVEPLGLKWFALDIYYVDRKKLVRHGTVATVTVDWEYMQATITVNLRVVQDLSDSELERCLLHELVHILLAEVRGLHSERGHLERTVQMVTKALQWVRDYVPLGKA